MDIILMHKNDVVAKITFTEAGYFKELEGFFNQDLMPPGTRVADAVAEQRIKSWLELRCIPKDRENYIRLLSDAEINAQEQFYFKNFGLSLNDCYWLRSAESFDADFGWEQVNFFRNYYSDYVGNLLTDENFNSYTSNYMSPDLTTNGLMKKMWYQDQNTLDSYLLKFGSKENNYKEIYFEAAAALIADKLGINNCECQLVQKQLFNGETVDVLMCKNFCNENIEFIPAQMLSVEPGMVGKHGLLNFAKKIGVKSELDKMLVFDYIICNPERNFSNFGFLRDANNFNSLGMAPLFGNSQALWSNYNKSGINKYDDSKPFDTTHDKQIELVDDFSWINFDNLYNIEFEIKQIFKKGNIPAEIQDKICFELNNRIQRLKNFINNKNMLNNKSQLIFNNKNSKQKITLSQPSNGFGN